jgi:hypothetical protein
MVLTQHGDYVVFHGLSHSWHAEQASVVIAVHWPSIPGIRRHWRKPAIVRHQQAHGWFMMPAQGW